MQFSDPIFITGNSRSGTTMMGRILGNHPDVFLFRELHFYEELWMPGKSPEKLNRPQAVSLVANLLSIQREGYMATRNPDRWLAEAEAVVNKLSGYGDSAADLFREFLSYETAQSGRQIACEQTPRNIFYLDQILQSFPNALIVEMVRDPRDVLLSKKEKWKRSLRGDSRRPVREGLLSWANYHPDLTTRLWMSAIRAGDRYANDARVIRVHYENLLKNPEQTIATICNRAGIQFSQSMLAVPQIGSSTLPDSESVGLTTSGVGRWRNSRLRASEIYICQKIAGSTMQPIGYSLEPITPNPFALMLCYFMLPVKMTVALLLNMRRIGSFAGAIKRRIG